MYEIEVYVTDGMIWIKQGEEHICITPEQACLVTEWIQDAKGELK